MRHAYTFEKLKVYKVVHWNTISSNLYNILISVLWIIEY